MRSLQARYREPQQGLDGSQRSFSHFPAPWQNRLYLSFSWQVYVQLVLRHPLLMGTWQCLQVIDPYQSLPDHWRVHALKKNLTCYSSVTLAFVLSMDVKKSISICKSFVHLNNVTMSLLSFHSSLNNHSSFTLFAKINSSTVLTVFGALA